MDGQDPGSRVLRPRVEQMGFSGLVSKLTSLGLLTLLRFGGLRLRVCLQALILVDLLWSRVQWACQSSQRPPGWAFEPSEETFKCSPVRPHPHELAGSVLGWLASARQVRLHLCAGPLFTGQPVCWALGPQLTLHVLWGDRAPQTQGMGAEKGHGREA